MVRFGPVRTRRRAGHLRRRITVAHSFGEVPALCKEVPTRSLRSRRMAGPTSLSAFVSSPLLVVETARRGACSFVPLSSQDLVWRCSRPRRPRLHTLTRACATEPESEAGQGQIGKASGSQTKDIANAEANVGAHASVPGKMSGSMESALVHTMKFEEVQGLRRMLRGPRMFFKLRGRISRGTILTIRLGGALSESTPTGGPFSRPPTFPSLSSLTSALRLAAHDPRIAHIYIRMDLLGCGWAKVFEVRRHLEYFCASGKKITVYMETGSEKEFFLFCGLAGVNLHMPPEGALSLRGFSASGTFLRGVLEKVGVEPQVERIGVYKSAGDQLGRKDMSDAQRTVMESLVTQVYDTFLESVAASKGVTPSEVAAVLDRGIFVLEELVEAGYLTSLKYLNEIQDDLKKEFLKARPGENEDKLLKRDLIAVPLNRYVRRTSEKLLGLGGRKRIAVIRAVGAITSGKSGRSPLFGETLGSDTFLELVERARKDQSVKGVVLRVDSPGGSALASDIMWQAVGRLAEEKPVVASMVDVAASGGFYISMGVPIVAEASTLTGSVGVVTAKPSLGEFYDRIGYGKETISRGRYAELLDDSRVFTADEAEYFRKSTEHAYRTFVSKAARSRGLEYDAMDAVAQGRVWSGLQASKNGLVDHLGGFWRAVELVKEKADIKDAHVSLAEIRPRLSALEQLGLSRGAASMLGDNLDCSDGSFVRMLTSGTPLAFSETCMGMNKADHEFLSGGGVMEQAALVRALSSVLSAPTCERILEQIVGRLRP